MCVTLITTTAIEPGDEFCYLSLINFSRSNTQQVMNAFVTCALHHQEINLG